MKILDNPHWKRRKGRLVTRAFVTEDVVRGFEDIYL
jgi:hypothetical protein